MRPGSCRIMLLLFSAMMLMVSFSPVSADGIIPTKTTVYIDKDDQPFTGPVTFNVSCYGYMCRDPACRPDPSVGERDPRNAARVFFYSATCPGYGCVIYQPFYLNHRHITWCDMAGTANGTPFVIRNFSESPIPDCTYKPQWDTSDGKRYYRFAPEFYSCKDERERNKIALCEQYIIPLSWDEIEKTGSRSWFGRNGSYRVRTDEYFTCISQFERENPECIADNYPLREIDPGTFERDNNGGIIGEYCTLRIALPSTGLPDGMVTTGPTLTTDEAGPVPTGTATHGNIPDNRTTRVEDRVGFPWCPFISIFGISC